MKTAKFWLLLGLALLGAAGAGCASPRRPGCNVQSDCTNGTYCAEPDSSGNRFCSFDCKVPGDCIGMAGAICTVDGRCKLPGGDDGGIDDDAEVGAIDAAMSTIDAAIMSDAAIPDAAAPDAFTFMDAAVTDARVVDAFVFQDAAFTFMDAAVACTLVAPQTGCTGMACDLVGDRNMCRANGTQLHGQPCGVGVDCVAGATCLSDDRCHQFCVSGGAACPNSGTCSINVIGSMSQTLANACADPRPVCDVLAQNCVTVGNACYIDSTTAFHCYNTAGTLTENAVCTAVNTCVKPLSCMDLGAGAGFHCTKPCDRTAAAGANGCRAGQTCSNAGLGAFVGLCTPPMP